MDIEKGKITLSSFILKTIMSGGVYVWKRGSQYLYVGCSSEMMRRVGRHNIIGCCEPVQVDDVIEFYPLPPDRYLEEERRLNLLLKPKYSRIYTRGEGVEERPCSGCSITFKPARFWQKFCSVECQSGTKKIMERKPTKYKKRKYKMKGDKKKR